MVEESGSKYMTWNYEPKVPSCMSPQERTICEIIYVNSDIPRMGMVYLTSHLHTISPCRLMSPHLAGDILGGDYTTRERIRDNPRNKV